MSMTAKKVRSEGSRASFSKVEIGSHPPLGQDGRALVGHLKTNTNTKKKDKIQTQRRKTNKSTKRKTNANTNTNVKREFGSHENRTGRMSIIGSNIYG